MRWVRNVIMCLYTIFEATYDQSYSLSYSISLWIFTGLNLIFIYLLLTVRLKLKKKKWFRIKSLNLKVINKVKWLGLMLCVTLGHIWIFLFLTSRVIGIAPGDLARYQVLPLGGFSKNSAHVLRVVIHETDHGLNHMNRAWLGLISPNGPADPCRHLGHLSKHWEINAAMKVCKYEMLYWLMA